MTGPSDAANWVDSTGGTVSRSIFVDEAIYKQEQEQIFARAWLFVGHESQVPNPGDYFVSRMGEESVILTRDRTGQIHVLLNSCTHRGMKVCRYDHGNTRLFTCPYHGWSFSTDGKLVSQPGQLVGVPGLATHYHGELDRLAWGLQRTARTVNYKGTIWASWDAAAPDFLDYLGDMKFYLDAALDHRDGRPGGSELIGGVQKWRIKCNWKFAPENFIGDRHHDISHRSVDLVGIGPSGGKGRRDNVGMERLIISFPELGHGTIAEPPHYAEPPYTAAYSAHPDVAAYYKSVYDARVRNLGDQMRVTMSVGTIFPNMSFHGRQPRTIIVSHPCGPGETELWRFYLIDKDAPDAVKEAARHYYLRYSGPGGMTESDDMENWSYATQASKGVISSRMRYNYQMGLGHAEPVPGLRGAVQCGTYSEENARTYYRRWSQFMQAGSWDDMRPAPAHARVADGV